MSSDITTQAVRLALGMNELQARVASVNIANASRPDARAMRVDFGALQSALSDAASTPVGNEAQAARQLQQALQALPDLSATTSAVPIQSDEQVADMVTAGLEFQALSEALSRHFGLMRLAIAGRN